MNDHAPSPIPFRPQPPDVAGVLTWVHLGDLHMTRAGEQNHRDLQAIVAELNASFADSTSFVFLPGDVADDGSVSSYATVRGALDQLQLPWCAIVGDHDVHEEAFTNFKAAMSAETQYAFTAGRVRFIALNAFERPHPASFEVSKEQLRWCEQELKTAVSEGQQAVLFLHCYPSELKIGAEELTALVRKYAVRFVDMGHTHYNEISNDGTTLYAATRSTGQIEEGPVGFAVVAIDGTEVSWKFFDLGSLPAVMITSPADVRLRRDEEPAQAETVSVRAKIWSPGAMRSAVAKLGGQTATLEQIAGSRVWAGTLQREAGARTLEVCATTEGGTTGVDRIELEWADGAPQRQPRDLDNALAAWPEHGLLGTQLGPNKNGRKW